jgi:uncharacterized protein (TIGR04255 family)
VSSMAAESAQQVRQGHRFYPRAPIIEAILELSFADQPIPAEGLRDFAAEVATLYPTCEDVAGIEAEIQLGPQGVQTVRQRPESGFQLKDADSHRLVRLLPARLSFHEKQWYQGWETFVESVKPVMNAYLARFPRQAAARLGLRYINRLDIPSDETTGDLRTWVRSAPDIPEGLPQFVSTYSVQMAMPQPDLPGVIAVMRQAMLQQTQPESFPIILDIDVFRDQPTALTHLWSVIEALHERENLIFERTITDRVRGLIA